MKLVLALVVGATAIASAQGQDRSNLTIDAFSDKPKLQVTAPAFAQGQAIPAPYSAYGENFSPALSWKDVPSTAKSIAIVIEDPDAKAPAPSPFVHWVLFNLPVDRAQLHESVPAIPRLPDLGGAQQGRNSRGTIGYFGPKPPPDDGAHHYHFEVFALDAKLDLPPGIPLPELRRAMTGHVVAAGETVGTFDK